ncbi:hypothetical protein Salat_0160800 [Sesamum alatum]|uniref:Uncharacterized protein n=1 Tax=Sesamum alatum TaxID=300844 RepID=A0AAE1YXT9_9LAMI|nr:hypothetical protein Salat_0160800 [Sesamum alatum]
MNKFGAILNGPLISGSQLTLGPDAWNKSRASHIVSCPPQILAHPSPYTAPFAVGGFRVLGAVANSKNPCCTSKSKPSDLSPGNGKSRPPIRTPAAAEQPAIETLGTILKF